MREAACDWGEHMVPWWEGHDYTHWQPLPPPPAITTKEK